MRNLGGTKRRLRKFSWSRGAIYLLLSLFCLSTVAAFAWVFMISLKTTPEFLSTSPWSLPQHPHFENYRVAWQRAKIGTYFFNSILVATVGACGSVMVSALAAYVIARVPFRANGAVGNFFLVGYMVPVMLTIIPLFLMLADLSNRTGLRGFSSGMAPLLALYVATGIPFNTFVLRGFYESLPSQMEEAAAVDGASPMRTFFQIMLPLSWSGLVSTFLINFLSLWNEFFLALLFLTKETATLPLGLFYMAQRAEYTAQWTDLFAGMLITTVPVLILFALLQDQVTKGMTEGAVKG